MRLVRLRRMLPLLITAGCSLAFSAQALAVADDSSPAGTAKAPPRQVVKMRLAGEDGAANKLSKGKCQWLQPCDAPQQKLLQEPKYKSLSPIYYAARCGDGKDPVYCCVLDEGKGPGKGYDTIYVDADNDKRIDADKERFQLRVAATPEEAHPIRVRLQVTSGGVTAPYCVGLAAFDYCDDKFPIPHVCVTLRDSSYYVGEAVLGAKTCRIAIADLNNNGLFNDVEQDPFQGDRFFVAPDADGQFSQSFPYGGFTQIAGQWYSIVASPDGGRVEITAAQPPLGKIEAPAEIAGARLNAPAQALDLDFQDGPSEAVAGTYRVHGLQLLSESGWALSGSFPDGEPELTVRAGQTVRLAAGYPLKVEPQAVSDEDRTLRINLRLTGAGGETYAWAPQGGSSAKAGFEIRDSSGKLLASSAFAYG